MSKKSTIALIIIVVVIVIVAVGGWWYMSSAKQPANIAPTSPNISLNQTKTAPKQQDTAVKNDQNNTPAPAAANSTDNPTRAVPTQAPANSLIGTWVSSVKGKGMQGSGKIVLPKFTTQLEMSGDVNLVIKTVADNIASGIISYSNLCTVSTVTMPGKPAAAKPPQCVSGESKEVQLHVNGNALTFAGQTSTGANVSFTGNYTNDTMSGAFTIAGSYGDMKGTFSLERAKN